MVFLTCSGGQLKLKAEIHDEFAQISDMWNKKIIDWKHFFSNIEHDVDLLIQSNFWNR